MTSNLEQLHKDDLMAELAIAFQQYGVRNILLTFRENNPLFYNEMEAHFNRNKDPMKIPVLLMKKGGGS